MIIVIIKTGNRNSNVFHKYRRRQKERGDESMISIFPCFKRSFYV